MLCTNLPYNKIAFLILYMTLLFSCSGGVQSGSSSSSFSGVGSVTVLSPTSVLISWSKNASVKSYKIYQNGTTSVIGETAVDFFIIENLQPDTSYTFKVVGVSESNAFGSDKEIQAKTWPRFTGIVSAQANEIGNIELTWDYIFKPLKYLIFYRKDSAPTTESTSQWTVANAETTNNKITLTGLDSSSTYHFIVHAVYRVGENEITTKTIALTTNTSFSAPIYSISSVSIGNVPSLSVDPVEDALHGEAFFKTTVLWNGNIVSDPLIGKGQILLSASANFPLGKLENISLKVEYSDGNRSESMVINGLTTYIKGMPSFIEKPASETLSLGASYMGKVLAKGDFNCDGLDDLAVGLPDMSAFSLGVKTSQAGAVIIYYSKEISPGVLALNTTGTPSLFSTDGRPQIITFDDLGPRNQFGFSLSSGNFNGDKNGLFSCEDLIVGAPLTTNSYVGVSGSFTATNGAAFIFFGSTKGLSSASHLSDMAANSSTCDGSLSNAICSPVKLFENTYSVSTALTGGQQLKKNASNTSTSDRFGYVVSFIGDFNADGYDDIAIGAPYSDFDGRLSNLPNGDRLIHNAGAVFIFFGSKFGLGYEYPAATGTPNPTVDPRTRYIKLYAPIPQSDALFGFSIAGGGDVDGYYKIRSASVNYFGGSDMVVGSPGFKYDDYINNNFLAKAPYSIGSDPATSSILSAPPAQGNWWDVGGIPISGATNYYGFPQSQTVVGAAYLYFGRGSTGAPGSDENPSRANFWKCGRRGMTVDEHYSCLFDNGNVKMLTPRKSTIAPTIRGFGSAVAILGSKSRWKENSITTLLNATPPPGDPADYFKDTNEDGYADVVVSAPQSTVNGNINVGILQVYYGNGLRLFNPYDFYNIYSNGNPLSDTGVNSQTCSGFIDGTTTTKRLCAPTMISSNSLGANSQIGSSQNELSVGDVTGDGLLDLAVGDSGDNVIGAGSGAALIFTSIKNQGLSSTFKKIYTTSADANDNLGRSVVIGNFNGDLNSDQFAKNKTSPPYIYFSYGDLFAGAPNDEIHRAGGGGVYGFFTQNTSLPSTISIHDLVVNESLASFTEYGLGDTRIVGDINNDGFSDAVSKLASFDQKGNKTFEAVIYYGSSIGLVSTNFCLENQMSVFGNTSSSAKCYPAVSPEQGLTLHDIALPQKILKPSNLDPIWNTLSIDADDVNNDGFTDVLFIPGSSANIKYSSLYFGSRTGLLSVVDPSWLPAAGDPQIVSGLITTQTLLNNDNYSPEAAINRTPFLSSDFNGDGFADLAVGLPGNSSRYMNVASDQAYTPDPSGLIGGPAPAAGTGWQCAIMSPECTGGAVISWSGSVIVLYGSNRGYQTPRINGDIADLSRSATNSIYESEESVTKPCLDSSSSSTDPVCNFSYVDNPVFENIEYGYSQLGHQFGQSIVTTDVNNDGYKDLLVSAPGYEDLSCYAVASPRNYGRVYVYYGSEFGLLATEARKYYRADLTTSCPANFSEDDALKTTNGGKVRAIMPSMVDYGNSQNLTERHFGYSMASAGDVNKDGYDDFLISTPFESTSNASRLGMNYLYYGPLCPADNHDQITGEFQTELNLNIQRFYKGQLPPLLGSSFESNVTLADSSWTSSCFRGLASKMKPMPQKFLVHGGTGGDNWGLSLFSTSKNKGDFNRDGYDDVIVGSPFVDDIVNNLTNIGQGVVFFGSENGLYTNDFPAAAIVQTSSGQIRPFSILPKGYTSGSQFFERMGSSGDVNGDGTLDIIIPSVRYNGVAPFNGVNIGTFLIFN